MEDKVNKIQSHFKSRLAEIKSSSELEDLRVKFLGKKGPVQALMQELKNCPPDQRPKFGKQINELKSYIAQALEESKKSIQTKEREKELQQESIDISLPGRSDFIGRMHPINQMMEEMIDILAHMGFTVQLSPEVESEYYNYGGLNYPEDHPARDMQDTFYLSNEYLLRSHTTNFQQRVMEKHAPPIRVISPGKCYRNETITSRSHVIFHQIDALYIDKDVTFADLLATKEEFYSRLFRKKIEIRVRPSYFPFVEPGMEVDIRCTSCDGKGCRLCKETGWLEVAGAGMVHPEVIREGGLDPEIYTGFAWGGGVERLFMLRHGVTDIRLFLDNDLRFLRQF
ncbi:MAG: phenylalanine--tRNA ligase subunit alpha [Simkaniaceae bacterium]